MAKYAPAAALVSAVVVDVVLLAYLKKKKSKNFSLMKRTKSSLTIFLVLLISALAVTELPNLAGADPIPAPPISQIYIRSDGTVDPSTAPIQREGSVYTFRSDLTNSTIEVQRDNIIIDGAGFTLQGNDIIWDTGITLANRSNVILKNINIRNYWNGIFLAGSSSIIILNNTIFALWEIVLDSSTDNLIIGNNIVGQYSEDFGYGIMVSASNNMIIGNNFDTADVVISGGRNNTFYHNNFMSRENVVFSTSSNQGNLWDNGKEGNFWGDYSAVDANGDGIGDTPYIPDAFIRDNFPLMAPFDIYSTAVQLPDWASWLLSEQSVVVLSPQNTTYAIPDVPLSFTVPESTKRVRYSLDGQANVTVTENTTLAGLANGFHNLTLYADDPFGNTVVSETVRFSVEVPEPFPTTTLAVAASASVTAIGVGLIVYFKKRKR